MSQEVGSITRATPIVVTEEQAASISKLEAELAKIHRDLGAAREQFLMIEGQIVQALANVRQSLQETVNNIGKEHGLPVEPNATEQWRYDIANKSFVRVA